MDSVIYTPKDYGPAIYLALNHAAGGLEILDYMYMEESDVWFVECDDKNFGHIPAFKLNGSFVRACYKAIKSGITRWVP